MATVAADYTLKKPIAPTLDIKARVACRSANLNPAFASGTTLDFMPPMLQLATGRELWRTLTQLAPVGGSGTTVCMVAPPKTAMPFLMHEFENSFMAERIRQEKRWPFMSCCKYASAMMEMHRASWASDLRLREPT